MKKTYFILAVILIIIIHFSKIHSQIVDSVEFKTQKSANNKNYELYSYIQKENEFIKANKIKTIKIIENSWRKIYYNPEGELTKIEYGDESIWGTIEIVKNGNKYYYKTFGTFNCGDEYNEIDIELFIEKRWPCEETMIWSEIIFNDMGKIESENIFEDEEKISTDFYIYNENKKIDKIMTYSFFNENESPTNEPKDYKINNNKVFELIEIKKHNYDDTGKLIYIEYDDKKSDKQNTYFLKYNERGLQSEDERGKIIEYEYYE